MEILVTGGRGFLGKHVVRKLLQAGHAVRVFGRAHSGGFATLNVKSYQGDLANMSDVERAVKGVGAVFHVAAKTGVCGRWDDYYACNVIGTQNIIAACRKHNVQDLIYTSTPSVVFEKEDIINGDERLPYARNFLCHYAHTKRIAEECVLQANDHRSLRAVALRPHLLWGPGDPHLLPRIIEKARRRELMQVGDGENLVDVTYIENAANAHVLAWQALQEGRSAGKAYFISQGEPVNLWQWIRRLLERMKLPSIERTISFKKAYYVGAMLEGVFKMLPKDNEPPMTRFVACQLAKSHCFDISAARRDLKYVPNILMESGLNCVVREAMR